MKSRTATKVEKKWLADIRDLGCIVCLNEGNFTPTAIHHIDGKTKPDAHLLTIPLCFHHHQGGVDTETCTSRHPFKARFEARYGTEAELLAQTRSKIEGI